MIRHDHITNDVMTFALQMIKPFVHFIVSIGKFKQVKPTAAGNGNEVDTIVFSYFPSNTHSANLTIGFQSRRVPETGDSAETQGLLFASRE